MSTDEDHERLADELEQEAEHLKQETDRLGGQISDVRSDWESKRQDPAVPGATPPEGEERSDDKGEGGKQPDPEPEED
jgi:hypothetical protein